MCDHKHSRRDILKILGMGGIAAASPVELLLDSLVGGMVSKALAQQASGNPNKYILIETFAAPPRWSYDLFLKPYGGEVAHNGSVATEYNAVGGRYVQPVYRTHKVKGINAPILWTHDVEGPSGKRPLSDLMDHMLILQGIDALNPGHVPAAALINRPLTALSLDGALADTTHAPFGALSFGGAYLDFRSKTGKTQKVYASSADIVKLLPAAFNTNLSQFEKKYNRELSRAVASLNKKSASLRLKSGDLTTDAKGAKKLILGELRNLENSYTDLFNKYDRIIKQTGLMSKRGLRGLTDKPIGVTGTRNQTYWANRDSVCNDPDLRDILEAPYIAQLAKQFALTEYVIREGLTSTVSLNVGALGGLKINNVRRGMTNDQHGIGVMLSTLSNTVYFRIISACLLALVDSFKATAYKDSNLFDYTVIRQTGEFGRSPRASGSGSDHAPQASNAMILSGMVESPLVAGQITKGPTTGSRKGSWGVRGNLETGRLGTTGHVVSSVAAMLDISSPSPNNSSLIVKNPNTKKIILNENYIKKTVVKG